MAFFIKKLGKKLGAWFIRFLKDLRTVFMELIRFLFPGAVKQPLFIARNLCKASTRKQLVQNMLFLLAAYAVSVVLMFCKSLWAGSVYTIVLRYMLPLGVLCAFLSTVYNASPSGLRLILVLSIFGVMVQTAISTTTAAELIRHHFFAVVAGLLGAISYYFLAQLESRCTVRLLNTLSVFIYVALLFSSARHSAKNWLSIGEGSVQGTEITRLLAVICAARICTMPEKSSKQRTVMVFQTLFLHLGFLVLVNELSTGVIILITGIVLLLLSVRQLRWTALGLGVTSLAGYIVYLTCKLCFQLGGGGIFKGGSLIYRKLIARVHPEQASDSFQLDAARKSLLLSDWFGSNADVYVPASDTDFILVSGIQNFGYTFFFILIFLMFALLMLALLNVDHFSFPGLLSLGCILTLEIQFYCNAASALAIGPIMGLTCPFLSLGGTSLVVTFFFCGVLLAASSSLPPEKPIFFYKRKGEVDREQ